MALAYHHVGDRCWRRNVLVGNGDSVGHFVNPPSHTVTLPLNQGPKIDTNFKSPTSRCHQQHRQKSLVPFLVFCM